jgi:hypothetical protein
MRAGTPAHPGRTWFNLPLLPLWEKGAGGMRGKSAPECRRSLISPKKSTLERRGSPRRRAAHTGFIAQSPSARSLRVWAGTPHTSSYLKITNAPSPHAGGDARAPRTHVVQSPPSPLVGEGGRGMRGKSAPECRRSLISPKKSTLERRGSRRRRAAHAGFIAVLTKIEPNGRG